MESRLIYNSRLKRVRLHLQWNDLRKFRAPPAEWTKKTKEKLRHAQAKGDIEDFQIFTERLHTLWRQIRRHDLATPPPEPLKVTLAQGYRRLQAIEITATDEFANLTITPQARTSTLEFNDFLYNILARLEAQHIKGRPDRAQLRLIFMRIRAGLTGTLALKQSPDTNDYRRQYYVIRSDKELEYISLHLLRPEPLQAKSYIRELIDRIESECHQFPSPWVDWVKAMLPHTEEKLLSLTRKPQIFGLNLPYDLLIGYDANRAPIIETLAPDRTTGDQDLDDDTNQISPDLEAQLPILQLTLVDEGDWARISAVDHQRLQRDLEHIDDQWLQRQCSLQGVIQGLILTPKELITRCRRGESLQGVTVAKGRPAEAGETPYLHFLYNDRTISEAAAQKGGFRAQNFVKQHTPIAEVRYKDGRSGLTVTGRTCYARAHPTTLGIQAGAGVTLGADQRFYATQAGMPRFEGNVLSCQMDYEHKGSLTINDGPLITDGSVLIKGDVENGAEIRAKGLIVIEGNIQQARISSQANLEVQGGIIGVKSGMLNIKGDLQADFIENSWVMCGKKIEVHRSVLNSQLYAGTIITIGREDLQGILTGGSVSAWDSIECDIMGNSKGIATDCKVGLDPKIEARLVHLQNRYQNVNRRLQQLEREQLNSSSRHLAQKQDPRLIAKTIKRLKRLILKIETKIKVVRKQRQFNKQAFVTGRQLIYAGVRIQTPYLTKVIHETQNGIRLNADGSLQIAKRAS
jgi:hypothetical protein